METPMKENYAITKDPNDEIFTISISEKRLAVKSMPKYQ
jgi:hypothetical protein